MRVLVLMLFLSKTPAQKSTCEKRTLNWLRNSCLDVGGEEIPLVNAPVLNPLDCHGWGNCKRMVTLTCIAWKQRRL